MYSPAPRGVKRLAGGAKGAEKLSAESGFGSLGRANQDRLNVARPISAAGRSAPALTAA